MNDWPRCDGKLCEAEADVRLHMEGENCYFHGHLCAKHGDALQECLPATMVFKTMLRPISIEILEKTA